MVWFTFWKTKIKNSSMIFVWWWWFISGKMIKWIVDFFIELIFLTKSIWSRWLNLGLIYVVNPKFCIRITIAHLFFLFRFVLFNWIATSLDSPIDQFDFRFRSLTLTCTPWTFFSFWFLQINFLIKKKKVLSYHRFSELFSSLIRTFLLKKKHERTV